MAQTVVQPPHHGGIRALLRAEYRAGARRAAQGIVDIAHGHEGHAAHRCIHAAHVDAGDVLQRPAHRHKGRARFIVKPHACRRCRAAAAVIGSAAAQRQHDLPCAVPRRMDD